MKAKMATKEQRSLKYSYNDVFVNKLHNVHDLENNGLFNASG